MFHVVSSQQNRFGTFETYTNRGHVVPVPIHFTPGPCGASPVVLRPVGRRQRVCHRCRLSPRAGRRAANGAVGRGGAHGGKIGEMGNLRAWKEAVIAGKADVFVQEKEIEDNNAIYRTGVCRALV